MDFIKKNIVLVGTLVFSVGVSAFLGYKVIVATGKMNTSMGKVDELKKEIQKLNDQNIIPKQENLDNIVADREEVAAKKRKLQTIFGNPYRNAVKRMASALGMTESELREKWKKTFLEEANKGSMRDMIFNNFFNSMGRTKKEKAFAAFKKALKGSAEPLNNVDIDGCVMEALGVPRKMEPLVCKKFLSDMLHNLVAKMEDTEKKGEAPFVFGDGGKSNDVKFLTFEKYEGEALPMPEQVPYIFKHLKLIEDLLYRIKAAGLSRLLEISRENMNGKIIADDYLAFSYTIRVRGSLDAMRNLVNSLLEAYKDNEVYVIRSMTVEDVVDEAGAVFGPSSKSTTTATRRRGAAVGAAPAETAPPVERNVVLIGNLNEVEATIRFDYILFTGNDLVPMGGR